MDSFREATGEGVQPAPERRDCSVHIGGKVRGSEMGAKYCFSKSDWKKSLVFISWNMSSGNFTTDEEIFFDRELAKMVEPEFEKRQGICLFEYFGVIDALDVVEHLREEETGGRSLLDKVEK